MVAPRDVVYRWLLTNPTPLGTEPVDVASWQADGIVEALEAAGLLSTAHSAVEEAAQWLAEESRHPRYYLSEGWRLILSSETDLLVALTAAEKQPGSSRQMLTDARTVLLNHHRTQQQDPTMSAPTTTSLSDP